MSLEVKQLCCDEIQHWILRGKGDLSIGNIVITGSIKAKYWRELRDKRLIDLMTSEINTLCKVSK